MANPKIKKLRNLKRIVSRLRSSGKRVVFTNGCFDLIHCGHIKYLSRAKRLGDILVVGLNSDSSAKKIKGNLRPINGQRDRAEVLASLQYVDYVTVFNQPTPEGLIKELRPDILTKGGDWGVRNIVGSDFVKSYGGRVVRLPFAKGYSSSSLIRRISKVS